MVLRSDGTLFAFGQNTNGQLGDNTGENQNLPVKIESNISWKAIFAGTNNSFGIKTDGTLWAWGTNGTSGKLGLGTTSPIMYKPKQVGTENDWITITASKDATFAIKSDGSLWTWGNFSTYSSKIPIRVGTQNDWEKVSMSEGHILLLKKNGTLWASGENFYGQVGIGTFSSFIDQIMQVGNLDEWTSIETGRNYSLGLISIGKLWTWGRFMEDPNTVRNEPEGRYQNHTWRSVSTNGNTNIGIKSDGSLWIWGDNVSGQFGNGTKLSQVQPTLIDSMINCNKGDNGSSSTYIIKNDGSLWVTGNNIYGQLGLGHEDQIISFVEVPCPPITSINEQTVLIQDLNIYPVPASEKLTIKYRTLSKSKVNYNIIDMFGRSILFGEFKHPSSGYFQNDINISELVSGLYYLQLVSGFSVISKKIFK